MILKFELNQKELSALALAAGEEVVYAVPYDCDLSGNYVKNAFTVVTNKRLVLLRDAAKEKEYDLSGGSVFLYGRILQTAILLSGVCPLPPPD